MRAALALGDQFGDHHGDHRSGRQAKQKGQQRLNVDGQQRTSEGGNGLHHAAELSPEECRAPADALPTKRQTDRRTLGEILQGNADGQHPGAGKSRVGGTRGQGTEGHAHSQALGDIVQGDGGNQQP